MHLQQSSNPEIIESITHFERSFILYVKSYFYKKINLNATRSLNLIFYEF